MQNCAAYSGMAIAVFMGRDAILPILAAEEVDHLHYKHLGYDLPVVAVLPLHRSTHLFVTWLREWLPKWLIAFLMRCVALCWLYAWWGVAVPVAWRFLRQFG